MEIYFKIEFNMDIVIEFCKEVKNYVWFAHRFLCSLMRFHSRVSVCRNITFVSQPAITCSNLTTETLEQGMKYVQSQQYVVLVLVNFVHISQLVLVFLFLTLSREIRAGLILFEELNVY